MLRNIPAHDCRNCGACCGPTMASENEKEGVIACGRLSKAMR